MSEEVTFTSQDLTFTSDELTVLSDILRRVPYGNYFAQKPEFTTAASKIERARTDSYGAGEQDPGDHHAGAVQEGTADA